MASVFWAAALIFTLRLFDVSFAILRILMVMRGRKVFAWILGFLQALVFVTAIRQVITDLGNLANMLGYAAGFATGTVLGIILEDKIAIGYGHVRIMSPGFGAKITSALRDAGFAVTQFSGRGKDGMVDVLSCSIPRRKIQAVKTVAMDIDPDAFITIENVRPLYRRYWGRK